MLSSSCVYLFTGAIKNYFTYVLIFGFTYHTCKSIFTYQTEKTVTSALRQTGIAINTKKELGIKHLNGTALISSYI